MSTQEAFKLVGIVEARTRGAENDLRRYDRVVQNSARITGQSLGSTERGFLSAGRAASGFLERFGHISNIIQGIPQIGQLAGALTRPLFQAAQEGIRLNMTLEQAQIGYEQVAGSAEKADKFLRDLQQFGQRSPFRFEGLLQASRLMTAFGFDLNEQIPKLTIWGNAIAASGELSADKIHDVVTAFGQMRMAGRVNAQDMMQLTNANIPGWELLAKAIGKTVAETRKLSEAGRLDGTKAVEAITAMMAIDPRYKNMMARLEKTTAGRLSAGEDVLQFAQAKATKSLTGDISKTLEAALKRGDLVDSLAGSIDSSIKPISGALTGAITSMLTGDSEGLKTIAKEVLGAALTGGVAEGVTSTIGTVKSAIGGLVQDGVVNPFKSLLGINSPSKVFIGFGHDAADGFKQGFAESLFDGNFNSLIDRFLGQIEGRLSKAQKRAAENLAKLLQREPGFKDKLISGARARGINPDHLLNVMAVETSGTFNPSIKNPNSTASGLIQFMAQTARELGTTTEALRKMSATNQLDYVFKYFDHYFKGRDLSSQGALYAAVGTGQVGRDDNSVLMTRSDRGYAGNAATWDPNRDGRVQQGEMAIAAINKLGAGVNFTVNGSPVSSNNPVPVSIVSALGDLDSSNAFAARLKARNNAKVGGDIGLSDASMAALKINENKAKEIVERAKRMREGNGQLSSEIGNLGATVIPRATQALEKTLEVQDRLVKSAGEWGDVISENEEALARMRFDWNAIGASFESGLQRFLPDLFFEGGKKAGLHFLLGFVQSIGDEASRQFSAIISKQLFNFDGGASRSDGGSVGGLVRKLFGKIGLGNKSGSGTMGQTTGAAMGGLMQNQLDQAIKTSTDRVTSGQVAQTGQLSQQIQSAADRIIDGLTPRQQGFWRGLLGAALSGAVQGATGAAVNMALGGDGGGGGGGTPSVTSTVSETDAPSGGSGTRPRRVGGGRALGGATLAGETYLIGEKGKPELLTMGNKPGWVTPLQDGRPEIHNHYHFNVHAHGADAAQSIQKSRRQLERQAARTLSGATRLAA